MIRTGVMTRAGLITQIDVIAQVDVITRIDAIRRPGVMTRLDVMTKTLITNIVPRATSDRRSYKLRILHNLRIKGKSKLKKYKYCVITSNLNSILLLS